MVEFGRVLPAQHHGLVGHRCSVCCQWGFRIARQSTLALSKKRYAAIISPQPLQALGTLAVGVAAILSINVLARRFRRTAQIENAPAILLTASLLLSENADHIRPKSN